MNEKTRASLRAWMPAIFWMLFIYALSSVPGGNFPKIEVPHFDKGGHFFEYSILGAFMLRGLMHSRPGTRMFKLSVLAVGLSILFGLSDEWHQSFTPGRSCDWGDAAWNAMAAIAGVWFFTRLRRKRRCDEMTSRGD